MIREFFREISRKIIHITILVALLIYFAIKNQSGQPAALLFLVALLLIFIILEYFRLDLKLKLKI